MQLHSFLTLRSEFIDIQMNACEAFVFFNRIRPSSSLCCGVHTTFVPLAMTEYHRVDRAPLVLFTPPFAPAIIYYPRKAPGKAAGLPRPLQHSLQVCQKLVKFIKSADLR